MCNVKVLKPIITANVNGLVNLSMKRYGIGSSQKQTLTDRTATMDDDVDFSGSVALNVNNGLNYACSTKI
jgi:hypothetical protein